MKSKVHLSALCDYANGRVPVSALDTYSYISTENMLPNKAGICQSSGLPTVSQTQAFLPNDVLISNIRPYFRKIWFTDRSGGCSNDVLVMRAKEGCYPKFLYYVLSDNSFFDYATATSKGTKMPRGDKESIMQYTVPDMLYSAQVIIANNRAINHHLEQMAQAIWAKCYSNQTPNGKLSDFFPVRTGKKDANVAQGGIYPFFSCSQNILYTDNYSFDAKAILLAGNGDFNVKVYNGKFEAYQRTYVLIPTQEKHLGFLYYAIKHFLSDITSGFRGSVIKFITKGNIESFELFMPEDNNAFDLFNSIVEQIAQRNAENSRLAELRDTLLPKLMSGELSVSDFADGK